MRWVPGSVWDTSLFLSPICLRCLHVDDRTGSDIWSPLEENWSWPDPPLLVNHGSEIGTHRAPASGEAVGRVSVPMPSIPTAITEQVQHLQAGDGDVLRQIVFMFGIQLLRREQPWDQAL